MKSILRRISAIVMALVLICSLFSSALGEQNTWDCPECGRQGNKGNYCGSCAHPAPWVEKAQSVNKEISDQLQLDIELDPDILAQPGPVNIHVQVKNISGMDLPEPVTLFDPDGQIVTSFGDGGQMIMKKDEVAATHFSYNVSQSQLEYGKLICCISYAAINDLGNVEVHTLSSEAEIKTADRTSFLRPVTNLCIVEEKYASVTLSWNASSDAIGYRIYSKASTDEKWGQIFSFTKESTFTRDMHSRTSYDFKVVPVYGDGTLLGPETIVRFNPSIMLLITATCRVRKGPASYYEQIGTIDANTKMQALEKVDSEEGKREWYKIVWENEEAYISSTVAKEIY